MLVRRGGDANLSHILLSCDRETCRTLIVVWCFLTAPGDGEHIAKTDRHVDLIFLGVKKN